MFERDEERRRKLIAWLEKYPKQVYVFRQWEIYLLAFVLLAAGVIAQVLFG